MFGRIFGKGQAKAEEPGAKLLSMALFANLSPPDLSVLAFDAKQIAPKHEVLLDASGDKGALVKLPSLGASVMVMHMPQRIPTDEVDEAAQYTMWYHGKPLPVPYTSHAVLVGMAPNASSAALASCIIAAALMKQRDAVAWYVGDAFSVFPSEFVVEITTDCIRNGQFPTPLWVRSMVSEGDAGFDASTAGLLSFGHNELEVIGSKMPIDELAMTLIDLATYIIDSGATLEHGQTCGGSAEEKWKIEVGTSKLGKAGKVARIRIP